MMDKRLLSVVKYRNDKTDSKVYSKSLQYPCKHEAKGQRPRTTSVRLSEYSSEKVVPSGSSTPRKRREQNEDDNVFENAAGKIRKRKRQRSPAGDSETVGVWEGKKGGGSRHLWANFISGRPAVRSCQVVRASQLANALSMSTSGSTIPRGRTAIGRLDSRIVASFYFN